MTVKSKVVLLSVLIASSLAVVFFLLLFQRVNAFLRENALQEAARLRSAFQFLLAEEKERFENHLPDYSMWTELGEKAVVERDEGWIEENLEPWVREQFGYSVLLVTESGEVITASPNWPFRPGEFPPSSLSKAVFLRSGENLWMVVTAPVTNDEGDKEYGAFLSFAKPIDAELLEAWSQILGCDIVDVSSGVLPPEWSELPSYWQHKSAFTKEGYLYVSFEVVGEPGELLKKFLLRRRYEIPLQVSRWAGNVLLCLGVGFGLLLFLLNYVFERVVLHPLRALYRASEQVASGEYSLQLPVGRNDEIGLLSAHFARMVGALSEREKELRREKRKAERLAQIDPLVGIPNRRYPEDRLKELIEDKVPFSLVFVDLDKFKKANDLLGHSEGDRCLKRIAIWFEKHIRKEDLVARYGGDEFCFVFPGLNHQQVEEVMERIHAEFVTKKFVEGITLDFSYGITSFPADASDIDKLLELADGRMYRKKKLKALREV